MDCLAVRLVRNPQEAYSVVAVSSRHSNRRPGVDFSVEASVLAPNSSSLSSNRNSRAVYLEDRFLEDSSSSSSRNRPSSRSSAKPPWPSRNPTNNSSPCHRACGHPAVRSPEVSLHPISTLGAYPILNVLSVHRTVPMQIAIVKDKWDAPSQSSPFRAYLYNHVGEDQAPFYQPGPEDDESKWEEALRQRPDPSYVPVLVKGFWELGKRAQRQKDFLTMMQSRLHEINNCLTELLSRHDLKISVKIADCRRKHLVLSKRCLALAAKTQVLRSRGYAMDDAEEELKKKLTQLERSVFDPSLNGRAEEIWARMLAIHEHSKRLQMEMERAGGSVVNNGEDEIDEQTMKTAKKVCQPQTSILTHPLIFHSYRSSTITMLKSSTCKRSWPLSRRSLRRRRS